MPQRQFRNRLSPGKINSGVGMLESGVLQRGVAGILNVSHSVISRMRNCHPTRSDPSHSHGRGLERTTNRRQSRFLLIHSRRHWFQNATSLNNELRNRTGVRISTQTVRNIFHKFGLNARRPAFAFR